MISQLTQTQLTEQPPADPRRPMVMAALALAEYLTAMAPLTTTISIQCAPWDVEATVNAFVFHDLATVLDWQTRFGGELTHEITETASRRQVTSTLTGRAFDGLFRISTVRDVQSTPKALFAEQQLAADWAAAHGDPGSPFEWDSATSAAYRTALTNLQVVMAK